MKTYTEQEIKAMCIPDIIKKMVELAGFKYIKGDGYWSDCIIWDVDGKTPIEFLYNNYLLFPLLIHRAVEGFNKEHHFQIKFLDDPEKIKFADKNYRISKYRKKKLTQLELALLHCLIEILKEGV